MRVESIATSPTQRQPRPPQQLQHLGKQLQDRRPVQAQKLAQRLGSGAPPPAR